MSLPYGQPRSQRQGNSLGQGEAEFCGVKTRDYLWKDIISTAANCSLTLVTIGNKTGTGLGRQRNTQQNC